MIQEKIDEYLVKERDKKELRQRSGLWSPSSFGRCYRYQYWNRLNEPKSNPIEADVLRRFAIGNLIHSFIQNTIKESYKSEILVKYDNGLGYADLVGEDEVIDIKSVRSYQFKLMKDKKKRYDFKTEKKDNILQVVFYCKALAKEKGRLVFVDKDSLDIVEFEFKVSEFEKDLQEELDMLNGYWNIKKLPPPIARAYNGNECKYCVYSIDNKCKEL